METADGLWAPLRGAAGRRCHFSPYFKIPVVFFIIIFYMHLNVVLLKGYSEQVARSAVLTVRVV